MQHGGTMHMSVMTRNNSFYMPVIDRTYYGIVSSVCLSRPCRPNH